MKDLKIYLEMKTNKNENIYPTNGQAPPPPNTPPYNTNSPPSHLTPRNLPKDYEFHDPNNHSIKDYKVSSYLDYIPPPPPPINLNDAIPPPPSMDETPPPPPTPRMSLPPPPVSRRTHQTSNRVLLPLPPAPPKHEFPQSSYRDSRPPNVIPGRNLPLPSSIMPLKKTLKTMKKRNIPVHRQSLRLKRMRKSVSITLLSLKDTVMPLSQSLRTPNSSMHPRSDIKFQKLMPTPIKMQKPPKIPNILSDSQKNTNSGFLFSEHGLLPNTFDGTFKQPESRMNKLDVVMSGNPPEITPGSEFKQFSKSPPSNTNTEENVDNNVNVEIASESSRDNSKETFKETFKETSRETSKETSKEASTLGQNQCINNPDENTLKSSPIFQDLSKTRSNTVENSSNVTQTVEMSPFSREGNNFNDININLNMNLNCNLNGKKKFLSFSSSNERETGLKHSFGNLPERPVRKARVRSKKPRIGLEYQINPNSIKEADENYVQNQSQNRSKEMDSHDSFIPRRSKKMDALKNGFGQFLKVQLLKKILLKECPLKKRKRKLSQKESVRVKEMKELEEAEEKCLGELAVAEVELGEGKKVISDFRSEEECEIGTLFWCGGILEESDTEEYLDRVKKLFPLKYFTCRSEKIQYRDGFSAGIALYLLHSCDYNIDEAISLLNFKTYQMNSLNYYDNSSLIHPEEPIIEEDVCFVCSDGGNLLLCDSEECKRVFHPHCVKINNIPEGKWHCPAHVCSECNKTSNPRMSCAYCATAYCDTHLPAGLVDVKTVEFLCTNCRGEDLTPRHRFLHRLSETARRKNIFLKNFRVGGVDIDLYVFYGSVTRAGGARRVTDGMGWSKVRKSLLIPDSSTNASSLLKSIYTRVLYPYEQLYFPASLEIEIDSRNRRGRPKVKDNQQIDTQSNETCNIMITDYSDHVLKIEANVNGKIKNGFLFLPQVVENNQITLNTFKKRVEIKKPVSESSGGCERRENFFGSSNDYGDEFYESITQLVSEVSSSGDLSNPDYDLAIETRFALKKMSMSLFSLAKILQLNKEHLNMLFNATPSNKCPETIITRIKSWLESLPMSTRCSIQNAVENFRFKEMTKLENLKVRVSRGTNGNERNDEGRR